MAKKNGKKSPSAIPWPVVKRIIIGLVGLALVWVIGRLGWYFLYESRFFKIQKIVLAPTLGVIDRKDLMDLQGQSLVALDMKSVYGELAAKYPQISDLKVYKEFPETIRVIGTARNPFARIAHKNKWITVDAAGVALDWTSKSDNTLIQITGVEDLPKELNLGVKVENDNIISALEVLRVFSRNPSLTNHKILKVDVGNLSKIIMDMDRGPDIIVDWTEIAQKSQMLSVVLSQMQMKPGDARYIDLRFAEPVIGRE